MPSFIHFGCWNNLNGKGCLHAVMNGLNTYLRDKTNQQPEFIAVAGDNYYPDKQKTKDAKKKKIVHSERLIQGFTMLPHRDIPIYMILGNHDLETNLNVAKPKLFIQNGDTTAAETGNCKILRLETTTSKNSSNIQLSLFRAIQFTETTLVLMIDTSMYAIDGEDYLPCYRVLLQQSGLNVSNADTIEGLRAWQNNLIYNVLETNNRNNGMLKNIITIGHHPIIGIKFKKEKDKIEVLNDIPFFHETLLGMFSILKEQNVSLFHLCADLHLYQSGIIAVKSSEIPLLQLQITQYIVGTGGTELDDALPSDIDLLTMYSNVNYEYRITENAHQCGFLNVEENNPLNGKLTFTPILFGNTATSTGGNKKRKTKRRKKMRNRRKTVCKKYKIK